MASFSQKDLEESIGRNDTQFGTRIADVTANRIDVPGTYPYNTERHALFVNGTFIQDPSTTTKFSDNPGTYGLEPDAGDTVEFRAREKVRYVPNYEVLWGAAAWYDSIPSAGQRLFVEFTDDAEANGYRYAFEPTNTRVEQLSAGSVVDSVPLSEWGDFGVATKYDHNPFTYIDRTVPLNPRSYVAWYGALASRYTLAYTRPDGSPRAPTLGYTGNQNGVATEEINLNIKIRAEAAADADPFTAEVCSIGALIRGNATQFDRSKNGPFWDLGGAISQYFTDNAPVLAGRIDPDREQVVVAVLEPEVSPAGTDVIEILGCAVLASDTDADFQDPDADGTNEGTAPRAQTKAQNDVMQWTRSVSTFPTTSSIRSDGTEGLVPDVRYLVDAVGEGGGNNRPSSTGVEGVQDRKLLYPGEVLLYIPRTAPTGNVTDGSITYLRPQTEQNW